MAKYFNAYDRALQQIGEKLDQMSRLAGNQLAEAMRSFIEQDDVTANAIIAKDDEIDALDEAIEMESIDLISLQQPVDADLRFLTAAMRISRELERISDYACDIAETVLALKEKTPFFKPLVDLPKMAELVQGMMRKSLKAHLTKDLASAREMDDDDNEVDQIFQTLLTELMEWMKKGKEYVEQASIILLVARYLERIGDHIVNISEMTIFMETGERHPFKTDSNK